MDVSGNARVERFYSLSTPGGWLYRCSGVQNPVTNMVGLMPLFRSCPNVANLFQTPTTGSPPVQDGGFPAAGTFFSVNFINLDNIYVIRPGYGIVAWTGVFYAGTVVINVVNNTNNAICIQPSITTLLDSYKLYYNNVEIPA